jgi:hypothetical protein
MGGLISKRKIAAPHPDPYKYRVASLSPLRPEGEGAGG